MPRGTECTTYQERVVASPHAPWHSACHLSGESSSVATCPVAQSAPPTRRGLRRRHVPRGTRTTACGRALASTRVMWLQTRLRVREGFGAAMCPVGLNLGRARAFQRYLTSGSSWHRKVCGAGSALNTYVTGHTRRMAGIKYVQDIDVAGR
jgi:hypothetical protein